MTNLNEYKEKKLDDAFAQDEQLSQELKVKLAHCDLKINNGKDMDFDDVIKLAQIMQRMKQSSDESWAALKRYQSKNFAKRPS